MAAPPPTSPPSPERTGSTVAEVVDPALHGPDKARHVHAMFDAISGRYDLLNGLLSFGVDRRWRAQAVAEAVAHAPLRILDVATGTADLALALKRARPESEVVGLDFVEAMLEIGRTKADRLGLEVRLDHGDGLALPYPDGSFDALTIAYGLRNFADVPAGLNEFRRVLAPGGRLVVLEFPPPPGGAFGRLYRVYAERVMPWLGGLLSGRSSAYRYLRESALRFPAPPALAEAMQRAGFGEVRWRLQTFGVSALHVAEVPTETGSGRV